MIEQKVFFSWQSDIKAAACRTLIERALADAIKELANDDSIAVEPVVDRDTLGLPGCPDIGSAIFSKVQDAAVFVADVTIINGSFAGRKTPNPNVLVELGFALGVLGWERVILVQNTAFGEPEALPFDLRQKRALTYSSPENADERAPERNTLQARLREALSTILKTPRSPRNPTVTDQLKQVPRGTDARLVYLPLKGEGYVHDDFKIEVLGVDDPGNVLRIKSQTGTPGGPDVIPLSDIEAVWTNEGVPFIRVSGFMDHTPLAPYRYKPRPQGTVPSATPERPRMSAEAEHMLRNIGKLYAEKGFPNYKTWWFQSAADARMSELRALGLVKTMGTRQRDGSFQWNLTDAGKSWVMLRRDLDDEG